MKIINLYALLFSTLFGLGSGMAGAQTSWLIDKSHSKISFNVAHMVVSEVTGQFHEYEGTITSEDDAFNGAAVEMNIQIKSIDTDDDQRDEHLKSPDFFDADKYPEIKFKATELKSVGDNEFKLKGTLTMHGVSKEIVLDATFAGTVKDMKGRTHAGFKVRGVINRTEFGLKYNSVLEAGGLAIGEEIEIVCNLELVK